MCQMTVVLDKNGQEELVMEDVTQLVVYDESISISTMFEEPKILPGVVIKYIDFLSGKTILNNA